MPTQKKNDGYEETETITLIKRRSGSVAGEVRAFEIMQIIRLLHLRTNPVVMRSLLLLPRFLEERDPYRKKLKPEIFILPGEMAIMHTDYTTH